METKKILLNWLPPAIVMYPSPSLSISGNSVGIQPTSGLRESVCIFFPPNRFASLGVTHIQPFGFTILDKLHNLLK